MDPPFVRANPERVAFRLDGDLVDRWPMARNLPNQLGIRRGRRVIDSARVSSLGRWPCLARSIRVVVWWVLPWGFEAELDHAKAVLDLNPNRFGRGGLLGPPASVINPSSHLGRQAPLERFHGSYLVDPASSHMLVSKIKPCMSKYKQLYSETANGSLNQL